MIYKLYLPILLVSIILGCSDQPGPLELIDHYPIPNEARDVKKLKLHSENNQQIFFRVDKAYPSTEIIDYYSEFMKTEGWQKCKSGLDDWQSYLDGTSKEVTYNYEIANFWIKRKEEKLAMLVIKYDSRNLENNKVPDNNVQHISLLVQKDLNLEDEMSRMSINCDV
jgi:hypothetical protein